MNYSAASIEDTFTGEAAFSRKVLWIPHSLHTLKDKPAQIYGSISWNGILRAAATPTTLAKEQSPGVVPSTYTGHDGRASDAQEQRGDFGVLPIDVDGGNHSLNTVQAALRAVVGADIEFLIFSTASSSPDKRKWRGLVLLEETVPGSDYPEIAKALFDLMERQSVACDPAMARLQQVSYLPNIPPERRDAAGQPLFYQWHHNAGRPLDLREAPAIIGRAKERMAEEAAREAAIRAEIEARRLQRETRRAEKGNNDDASPIEWFNARHTVEELFISYGYKRGIKGNWRSPNQTSDSYATRIIGDGTWFSLSASDAAAGLGHPDKKSTGVFGDAYDLFVHFEHGGDHKAACSAIGKMKSPARVREPIGIFGEKKTNPQEAPVMGEEAEASMGGPSIAATPYSWRDPATIPPRQWLYGRHLVRGFVSCTIAPGGVGKSSLLITDALAMVSGRNLVGADVARPLNVWIWNGEDPLEELERRIAAAASYYGLTIENCPGRLFLNSGRDTSIIVARKEADGTVIAAPVVEAMMETIRKNSIDAVIIDPFVSCHKAPENDNNAIDIVVKEAWARIADATGSASDLVHHTRKAGAEEITIEHARGASALMAGARSGRVLNVMSKEEALKARVGDTRRLHFNVTNGKSNMAPPSDKRDWFKLESVDLGNGAVLGQSDHVGVVTPWEWPDALEGLTVDDLLAVQTAIDGREYRSNVQSPDWVGHAIGEVIGIDTADPEGKERVKQVIKIWLKSGALVEERIKDKSRHERRIIKVGTWANT